MAKKAIVGEKVGMTQVWDDQNRAIPVTLVRVAPCRVVQVKTPDSDGYSAVQVTFGSVKESRLNKPEAGHFAKAGVEPGRKLVELRLVNAGGYQVGQEIKADILSAGERVDVTGSVLRRGRAVAFLRSEASVDGVVVAAAQVTKSVVQLR